MRWLEGYLVSARIVVLGYVVRAPLGGLAWHYVQYLLGLERLGHEVWFVEDSDDYESCYDPETMACTTDPSSGIAFADRLMRRIGLGDRWAYHDAHTGRWLGPLGETAPTICSRAEVVLNVSRMNPLRPWLMDIPHRIYLDTDPVFIQVQNLTDPGARRHAERHTAFATFAGSIGSPGCSVPDDGLPWVPTRQPVVRDVWGDAPRPDPAAPFTTVMQWDSYPEQKLAGRRFGMKSQEFARIVDLPARTELPLELALGAPSHVRRDLERSGWVVRDAQSVTRTPWSYRDYLHGSRGELSVAKHGYVATASGWFSERSANYLASGRPVIVQDTGFGSWLPTGEGVLAFRDADGALAGLEAVARDPGRHARAAREIAAEHFDHAAVLEDLLERTTSAAVPS